MRLNRFVIAALGSTLLLPSMAVARTTPPSKTVSTEAAPAPAATSQAPEAPFDPTGEWLMEVFVDGQALFGPNGAEYRTIDAMRVVVEGTGDGRTITFKRRDQVYPLILDGVERASDDGEGGLTRYFFLGPNEWVHSWKSTKSGKWDVDVCVPTPDNNTLNCGGVRGYGDRNPPRPVRSIWRRVLPE